MWSNELELTPYGELVLQNQLECEFCGRSVVGRFSDQLLGTECESCQADFLRLHATDKLVVVADDG